MVKSVSFSGKMLLYVRRNPSLNDTEGAMIDACHRLHEMTKTIEGACRRRNVPFKVIEQIQVADVYDAACNEIPVKKLPEIVATNAVWTGKDVAKIQDVIAKNPDISIQEVVKDIEQKHSVSELINPLRKRYFYYKECKILPFFKKLLFKLIHKRP